MLVGVCVVAALIITVSPLTGSIMAGTIAAFFLIEYVLPTIWATSVPLVVLFVMPGDALMELSDRWLGLFVFAGGVFLGATSLVLRRFRGVRRVQLLLPGLAVMYLAFYAIHASKGALRGGAYWLAALGLWVWLTQRMTDNSVAARRGVENAIIAIGAISGAIALAEFFGFVDPALWNPRSQSATRMFTEEIGRRTAGLSGHPLCLGTLCMLGCSLAIVRIVNERRRWRSLSGTVAGLIAAGAGLVFSGARGSWLALLCGLGISLVAAIRSRRLSGAAVIRGSLLVTATVGIFVLSSLGFIVRERLVGSASAPRSIGQRVEALQTIVDSLPDLPFLGVGPGGVDEFILRGGALLPNIENEYLIALVLGGPLAMLGLFTFALLATRIAYRAAISTREPGPFAMIVGLCVNIGTFNFFSWPIGPPLLTVVTCLAVLTIRPGAPSSDDLLE